jgi:hypothetical protein
MKKQSPNPITLKKKYKSKEEWQGTSAEAEAPSTEEIPPQKREGKKMLSKEEWKARRAKK